MAQRIVILEYPTECKSWFYANGLKSPHYPVPAKIVLAFYPDDTAWMVAGCPHVLDRLRMSDDTFYRTLRAQTD